jgi:hypothetical protein
MAMVTRMLASSGAGVGTNGILECKFLFETSTAPADDDLRLRSVPIEHAGEILEPGAAGVVERPIVLLVAQLEVEASRDDRLGVTMPVFCRQHTGPPVFEIVARPVPVPRTPLPPILRHARIALAAMELEVSLQRFDMIYDDNGKSSGLPRGMPLVTRMFARFKRTCVGSNRILECKILSKNAHRTAPHRSTIAFG